MDEALVELKKKYPTRQWTKYVLEKEIEIWKSKHKGKFRPYCQAAIWFFRVAKKEK